jgi:hypothetical protein
LLVCKIIKHLESDIVPGILVFVADITKTDNKYGFLHPGRV